MYKREFANYNKGTDDYMKYCLQQCEIDTRYYASKRINFYMEVRYE